MVGVAAVRMNGGAHVALTNMGDRPLRASAVEQALERRRGPGVGDRPRRRTARRPPSDAFGSAEYRKELSKVLVRRALEEALG